MKTKSSSRTRATSRGPSCYVDDLAATISAMYRRCPKRTVEIDAILRNALIAKGGKAKVKRTAKPSRLPTAQEYAESMSAEVINQTGKADTGVKWISSPNNVIGEINYKDGRFVVTQYKDPTAKVKRTKIDEAKVKPTAKGAQK